MKENLERIPLPEKPNLENIRISQIERDSDIPDSEDSQVHPKGEFIQSWPFAEGVPDPPKYKLYLVDKSGEEDHGVDLKFDPNSQTPYFNINKSGLRTGDLNAKCMLASPIKDF